MIFEDVFIPWERVFLCVEYDMTGILVERFAKMRRQNYDGCKGGSDILVGACAIAADYIRERPESLISKKSSLR